MSDDSNASDISTVPMLVQSPTSSSFPALIVLGEGDSMKTIQPSSQQFDTIWFAVFDRSSLEIVWQEVTDDADSVPAELQKLDVDGNMLVTVFNAKRPNALPQGDLYNFLVETGSGPVLNRLEQFGAQLMCGVDGFVGYSLVGIMGPGVPADGAVEAGTGQLAVSLNIITLVGVDINGTTFYTPTPTS